MHVSKIFLQAVQIIVYDLGYYSYICGAYIHVKKSQCSGLF